MSEGVAESAPERGVLEERLDRAESAAERGDFAACRRLLQEIAAAGPTGKDAERVERLRAATEPERLSLLIGLASAAVYAVIFAWYVIR